MDHLSGGFVCIQTLRLACIDWCGRPYLLRKADQHFLPVADSSGGPVFKRFQFAVTVTAY